MADKGRDTGRDIAILGRDSLYGYLQVKVWERYR